MSTSVDLLVASWGRFLILQICYHSNRVESDWYLSGTVYRTPTLLRRCFSVLQWACPLVVPVGCYENNWPVFRWWKWKRSGGRWTWSFPRTRSCVRYATTILQSPAFSAATTRSVAAVCGAESTRSGSFAPYAGEFFYEGVRTFRNDGENLSGWRHIQPSLFAKKSFPRL